MNANQAHAPTARTTKQGGQTMLKAIVHRAGIAALSAIAGLFMAATAEAGTMRIGMTTWV
jgi:hypothetical protein